MQMKGGVRKICSVGCTRESCADAASLLSTLVYSVDAGPLRPHYTSVSLNPAKTLLGVVVVNIGAIRIFNTGAEMILHKNCVSSP